MYRTNETGLKGYLLQPPVLVLRRRSVWSLGLVSRTSKVRSLWTEVSVRSVVGLYIRVPDTLLVNSMED